MILIIDNYDSFAYNLAQAFGAIGCTVTVERNDALTVDEALDRSPDGIVISPGPGVPAQAGVSVDLIRRAAGRVPILGVCLGHQCIAAAFGAAIVRSPSPTHGKTSRVDLDRLGLLAGLPERIEAARYHSLTVDESTLPPELTVSARTDDGEVMGLRHRSELVEGVQFHPESFLTPDGPALLKNFANQVSIEKKRRIHAK